MKNTIAIMICLLICCIDFIFYKFLTKRLNDQFYAYLISTIFLLAASAATIKILTLF